MKQYSTQTQSTKSPNRKWFTALVPAIAMGALVLVFWGRPISNPIIVTTATQAPAEIVLPLKSTLIVGTNSTAKPLILRGRLTVFNPQIVASPTSGMVARLLVQPGQMVKAGETIAMISNQAVPSVEKSRVALQERAEAAQEAANRQQSILQGKLAQEKVLLEAANQRVDRAAKRLADARELLRRLQNGEKIPRSQISDSGTTTPAPRESVAQNTDDSAEILANAQQQADQLAKVASQKWQVLHVLLTRQLAAKSSQTNANSTGTQAAAPTQDQIDAARTDAKKAQDAADKSRMEVYKLTVSKPAKNTKSSPATDAPKSTFISIADATKIANAALQESNDALAQVKSVQRQIQRYQAPVKSANSNFQAATSNLENTQRSLFDNPVKVPMTPVVAKSNGIVHRLATLAMQVNSGDEIASIVPANLLNLDVRDSEGAWKNLQVNAKFKAMVQTTSDPRKQISTDARLVAITPPKSPGQPSILHIQVFNPVAQTTPQKPQPANANSTTKPLAPPRVFTPGMIAVCAIPRADAEIVVPRKALRADQNNQFQVAVFKPQNVDPTSQTYTIQWNNVSIKADDGNSASVVIVSGLNQNDRIALEPEMLYHLTQEKGASISVQLGNS